MQRPGGERAASGSSSSRTAAWNPRDHDSRQPPWCLREQSTGKAPRKGLEHSKLAASRRHRRARRCTVRGLPSAAPAGKARHVGKAQLREGTVRAPRSVASAFGIHSQHRGVTDELGGVQCTGCLRQRQRAKRATSAKHSSAKRPSAHRGPSRGPSASIIKDR